MPGYSYLIPPGLGTAIISTLNNTPHKTDRQFRNEANGFWLRNIFLNENADDKIQDDHQDHDSIHDEVHAHVGLVFLKEVLHLFNHGTKLIAFIFIAKVTISRIFRLNGCSRPARNNIKAGVS